MKISEFFAQDHDRLDQLFLNFQEWKHKDYSKAREYFLDFKSGLQRHIAWEEEILFPLFERKTGMVQGPTHVMRIEHRDIIRLLDALLTKANAGDPQSETEERNLLQILSVHNTKEEMILYPMIDTHADESDVAHVLKQIELSVS